MTPGIVKQFTSKQQGLASEMMGRHVARALNSVVQESAITHLCCCACLATSQGQENATIIVTQLAMRERERERECRE